MPRGLNRSFVSPGTFGALIQSQLSISQNLGQSPTFLYLYMVRHLYMEPNLKMVQTKVIATSYSLFVMSAKH